MKNPKILYVSCHTVLEYDELRMFRDNGWPFFVIGAYMEPDKPHVNTRPPLTGCEVLRDAFSDYLKMCERNATSGLPADIHSKRFTKEFLDHFDVIIIMHIPDWIFMNWSVLRGRNVIWRTIGQSTPHVERQLEECRKEGLKIVRYSPKERSIPSFIGEDALIRFGKYPEDFKPWTGELNQVITIGQAMKQRGWWCNYDLFQQVTEGFPTKLYGNSNEGGQIDSYSELIDILSKNSVYFYTGTRPASYTLNFMEAAFAGIPIVSVGEHSVLFENHNYFEVVELLDRYKAGFSSDDPTILKRFIAMFLKERDKAVYCSMRLTEMAKQLFDAHKIKEDWKRFIEVL